MTGHPVFVWFYAHVVSRAEAKDGTLEQRLKLLPLARGTVLELGAGNGNNLPHYPHAVTDVLASEPDPAMRRYLAEALPAASRATRIVPAPAEALPVADGSIDTVVSTLTLCSVHDVARALGETYRVLRPDGRLLVYEHVRSVDPGFARRQDRWEGMWGRVAGGCHPNRDTGSAIRDAGFAFEQIERFDVPGTWLAKPHVRAVARKSLSPSDPASS
jgi:SAM-dependent methyltransferase